MPGATQWSTRSRKRSRSLAGDEAQGIFLGQHGRLDRTQLGKAFANIAKQCGAVHDVKRLLKRLQVLHAHDHGGGVTVPGDDDAAVLSLQAVNDLRQVVLNIGERHLLRH